MWILILTITTYTHGGAGGAISSVPGFTSEASCMAAAKLWIAQSVARKDSTMTSAVCAKS